ncbi:MAG: hypothetical protein ABJN42_13665 [Roseibium sp.]|uniref:hypothetical protein n=1 Tax=Roseibium sp. TaxID=1936156 RepID=UPI0032987097
MVGEPDGAKIIQDKSELWRMEITKIDPETGEHVSIAPIAGPCPNLVILMSHAETIFMQGIVLREIADVETGKFIRLKDDFFFPVDLFDAVRDDLWLVLEIAWTEEEFAEALLSSRACYDLLLRPVVAAGRAKLKAWILSRWANDVPHNAPDALAVAQERLLDDGYTYRPWPA